MYPHYPPRRIKADSVILHDQTPRHSLRSMRVLSIMCNFRRARFLKCYYTAVGLCPAHKRP